MYFNNKKESQDDIWAQKGHMDLNVGDELHEQLESSMKKRGCFLFIISIYHKVN